MDDKSQERRKMMHFVIEAAQTMIQCPNPQKRIVDDVLTMQKIDSGLPTIFPIGSQPKAEIRHALRIFEAEAREAKVDISLNTEESYQRLGVDWVLMDPTRLLQVFVNLLTNSIKFTRLEEQRKITISIGASEEPPYDSHGARFFDTSTNVAGDPTTAPEWGQGDSLYIIITVRDTGRGLTPEEKDLLFLRFSQASPKTHVTYGGSGLGLYISRRLAEMQGGAIGFDSTLGQGSTFSYYIKVRRSLTEKPKSRLLFNGELDLRDANILEKLPELLRRSSSETGLMAMEAPGAVSSQRPKEKRRKSNRPPNLHVLVVEDNLVNQRVLAKQLRNNGCIVEVANHGVEALKHIESTHFYNVEPAETPTVEVTEVVASPATPGTAAKTLNVVLMDWEMPVMDGVECVKKIRELQKQGLVKGHVPVIAVTANARQEQIDHALAAGFDDVCPKPCRVFDLLGRMDKLLDKLENGDEDSNDVATDVEDEESKDGSILRLVTSMQKA